MEAAGSHAHGHMLRAFSGSKGGAKHRELLAFLASLVTLCGHRVSHQRGRPLCLRQEPSWGRLGQCASGTQPLI